MSRSAHVRAAVAAARGLLAGPPRGSGAAVLAYHDVVPDDAQPVQYAVTARLFRRHLEVVARAGLEVVTLRALSAALRSGEDVTGRVAVVFDDALVGVHRLAVPALAERGWPATLHPVTEGMGVDPPWWPGSQRVMTWDELAQCCSAGLDLGAHSSTHACLPCQGDRRLAAELGPPKDRLEAVLGRTVDELAYPFGHCDDRVRDATARAGYTTGWSFHNGRVTPGSDRFFLPRLTMHQRLSPLRLLHQLHRRTGDWPVAEGGGAHPHAPELTP